MGLRNQKLSKVRSFAKLRPDLVSLGFAFYGPPSTIVPDPEKTILEIIELLPGEQKMFVMLLAWLEKARDLIHVERLKVSIDQLSPSALLIFGGLCLKQVHQGDRRFSTLVNSVRARMESLPASPKSPFESDPYLISKHGVDLEFLEFGIRTVQINASDSKKILTLECILLQNPWLRMRALMGANFRADVAYLMTSKRATNANQVFKILGCNLETAYRLWKALAQVPGIEKLAS
jgi:hypothetical protein